MIGVDILYPITDLRLQGVLTVSLTLDANLAACAGGEQLSSHGPRQSGTAYRNLPRSPSADGPGSQMLSDAQQSAYSSASRDLSAIHQPEQTGMICSSELQVCGVMISLKAGKWRHKSLVCALHAAVTVWVCSALICRGKS